MTKRLARTGLLLPVAAGYGVALGLTAAPAAAAWTLTGAIALLPVLIVPAIRRSGPRWRLVVCGVVVAGLVAAAVLLAAPGRHFDAVPTGRPVAVEVRVGAVTATAGNDASGALTARGVLRGTLLQVGERAGGAALSVPVVLFTNGGRAPAPGTVVRAVVVLQRAPSTDQAAYLGAVRGALRRVEPPSPVDAAAQLLRSRFLAVSARLPGDGGALLPGLAVGDVSRLDPGLQQAMRDASLTHLTAVSGANCAVVILAVLALAAHLRIPRTPRVLLAGLALAGFVVLVTPQPSVVRAAVMAAVGLCCVLAGRRTAGVPALALTVLVLLLLDPWIAWSAGFVLSVAATAGLLLLAPPLAERLGRVLPQRLALLLAVPVAAQAACQPVLVLLQPGIPVFGVLANLAAEPAVPVATVLGLLACLCAPVVPPLAAGLALLAWLPASWIALVARTVGALPQLAWLPGLSGALLAAVVVAGGVLVLRRRTPRAVRAGAAAAVALCVLGLAGAAVGGAVGRMVGTPRDWTLAACDVGQGDGLVLNGGGGRYAVVDTGREPAPMLACLGRLGVDRIDVLVLTHWDADHVGAATALAGRVRTALVGPADADKGAAVVAALRRAGARVVQVHRGDRVDVGRLRLDVLWPPDPLGAIEPGNAASVTLHVTGAASPSMLLTGDLGEEAQDALLRAGPLPQVDVIKVAHHGSADQGPQLYARAAAAIGVISVGAGNDYGHPTRRLLGILRGAGTLPVRTDQDGLVLIGVRDGRVRLWTERPVSGSVWTPAN